MPLFNCNNTAFRKLRQNQIILALGPESAGTFSVYFSEKIFFSKNFNDLLDEQNYKNFQKSILNFLKKNKIKPDIILTDLHPLYKTTILGQKLSQKFKTKHLKIQHHIAHIFSAIGDKIIHNFKFILPDSFLGIACDGTGYGLDGKIWGGEIFRFQISNSKFQIKRIGHLENQIMIGGDLAIKEPARMLIAILAKIQNPKFETKLKSKKDFIYDFVKKYYNSNEFELLYNQLQQNFNCLETSSAGRILDAASLLLGFCQNKRKYKHEPIDLLEKNSTTPYKIKPKIIFDKKTKKYVLLTTFLFEYLINNLHKSKKRLAATAQLYIAKGLYEIIKKIHNSKFIIHNSYFAGGMANNKIISNYLESKNAYLNKKIQRGDAGLSFGQIIWYLLS